MKPVAGATGFAQRGASTEHGNRRPQEKWLIREPWRQGLYPVAIALSACLLGLMSCHSSHAGIFASAAAGVLCVLRQRGAAATVALVMLTGMMLMPGLRVSVAAWTLTILMIGAAIASPRYAPRLLAMPHWTWAASILLGTIGIVMSIELLPGPTSLGIVIASVCLAHLGAGVARRLAMSDAKLLSWGEEGLNAVTRDLLLGRITQGMLHDLAQPLNVISMANGNLGYIVEHLEVDEAIRQQLEDRIVRIGTHTEGAAAVLALFRTLGREVTNGKGESLPAILDSRTDVRSALEHAVAATRSNVRHAIDVSLTGDALDHKVPGRHGTLEMLCVAAMLSVHGAFVDEAGNRRNGRIELRAELEQQHVVVTVEGTDESGAPLPCSPLDAATQWLVEQVAREAGGEFRCEPRTNRPLRLLLRLARDDV